MSSTARPPPTIGSAAGHGGVDPPDAREVAFVKVGGDDREVRVTPTHVRVAKALHTALPIVICPVDVDGDGAGAPPRRVDWDGAPLHHKLDLLELAHIALLAAGPDVEGGAPGS